MKYSLLAILACLIFSNHAVAGLNDLQNKLKGIADVLEKINTQEPDQAQPQQAQPQQAQPQQAQNVENIREKWKRNPYYSLGDVPKEVTDDDINEVQGNAFRKISKYVRSEEINKGYEACLDIERKRILNLAREARTESTKQKTKDDAAKYNEIAKSVNDNIESLSHSTCLWRVIRRASITLELGGIEKDNRNYPRAADESFNVVQLDTIGKAFEQKEFTEVFHRDLAKELSVDYISWLDIYLPKDISPNLIPRRIPRYDYIIERIGNSMADKYGLLRITFFNEYNQVK